MSCRYRAWSSGNSCDTRLRSGRRADQPSTVSRPSPSPRQFWNWIHRLSGWSKPKICHDAVKKMKLIVSNWKGMDEAKYLESHLGVFTSSHQVRLHKDLSRFLDKSRNPKPLAKVCLLRLALLFFYHGRDEKFDEPRYRDAACRCRQGYSSRGG
jgi:hypothetical protein